MLARRVTSDSGRDTDDAPATLPGFLTRSSAPAADTQEAPKPKRAPRKKVEAPAGEG